MYLEIYNLNYYKIKTIKKIEIVDRKNSYIWTIFWVKSHKIFFLYSCCGKLEQCFGE